MAWLGSVSLGATSSGAFGTRLAVGLLPEPERTEMETDLWGLIVQRGCESVEESRAWGQEGSVWAQRLKPGKGCIRVYRENM